MRPSGTASTATTQTRSTNRHDRVLLGPDGRVYAWYEMYPLGQSCTATCRAGDHMSASVIDSKTTTTSRHGRSSSSYLYTLTLTDNDPTTAGRIDAYHDDDLLRPSSAECITEAPYYENILPLADFGTVSYSSCEANGSPLTIPCQGSSRSRCQRNDRRNRVLDEPARHPRRFQQHLDVTPIGRL